MYPIDQDEFERRLQRWSRQPDRYTKISQDEAGRPTKEWWSVGVCRLRVVRYRDGAELWADRGMPGAPRRKKSGPISFGTWDESEFVHGDGLPHKMPMARWKNR